jgi:hypothetical protein
MFRAPGRDQPGVKPPKRFLLRRPRIQSNPPKMLIKRAAAAEANTKTPA